MNWYKIAKRSIGDAFVRDKLDIIFRKIVELDRAGYIKQKIKNKIKFNSIRIYITDFKLINNMQFGIENFFIKIYAIKEFERPEIEGTIRITNKSFFNRLFNNEYSNNFEIDLTICIPYNFNHKQYNALYYELSQAIRHEVEHALAGAEKLLDEKNRLKKDPDKLMETYNYLTNNIEIEAFVSGFYLKAKKEGKNVQELFKNYIFDLLKSSNSNNMGDGIINELTNYILKIWMDYAKKRFPNLEKKYELV